MTNFNSRVREARERDEASARVEVEVRYLTAPSADGITLLLNSADVRAVAGYKDRVYLATSGGLIAIDKADNVIRRYTTLDGLPENDLTVLATFRERLFIGTASSGLIGFDGEAFTSYGFTRPRATRISALVASESELLIGSLDGGLFEFDGERFTRRFNSTSGGDFSSVTALLPFQSRLYVGTQESGLYIWREDRFDHLSTSEGLPSPHVTALAVAPPGLTQGAAITVATDFGIVSLSEGNEVKPLTSRPNATSLAVSEGRLWAGLFSGGLIDVGSERASRTAPAESRSGLSEASGLPRSVRIIVNTTAGRLWALTEEGSFAREEGSEGPRFEPVTTSLAGERVLTAAHVTGLAFDRLGRIWVGYFDRGIDLIAPVTGERLSHIEDDRVREINFIAFDSIEDRILAATSKGLVSFAGRMRPTVTTREQGGLIHDSVAHVSFVASDSVLAPSGSSNVPGSRGMVLATAGGLTEIVGGRARSLTAFHGLASNHLYTSASVGGRLFVGSLSGLAEIEGLRVVRTYKTSNSQLSHDWVSALAEAAGTLYVGTNGGGVDALLPTGEWINFSDELGRFEVNQNAMHFDGARLFVGTSDGGLLVYNTRDRRWNRISAGLASQSVTAITSDDRFVFAGTSNGLVRIEKRVIE